jgi:hypothetical protein
LHIRVRWSFLEDLGAKWDPVIQMDISKGLYVKVEGGGEGRKVVQLNIKHIYQTFFWSNQVHAVLKDLLYLVWNERELFLEYQIEQVW